jgi:integrase
VTQYKRASATRRITLGSAEVLGAEAARAAAKKVLAKVALGEDPARERADRRDKDRLSLRSVVDEYLATKEVRPRTLIELRRYLTGSAFKPLHSMPVDVATRKDVASRLLAITREHGSIVAARARAALSTFYGWAMRMGIVEFNPVVGTIQPDAGKPRDRVLSDEELVAIWRACGDDEHGKIIRLLILTGCRRGEIGDMEWSEVDLERGTFTIPASRSKNGTPHMLPLMPMARDIVHSVPKMASRDQLFGQRSHGFTTWHVGKHALDARSRVVGWTVHDLRRSVATKLADLGVLPHVVEEILGHVSGHKRGVAGVYNKSVYKNEVRTALALWESRVHELIEGGERRVVNFKP